MTGPAGPVPGWPARYLPHALAGYALEARLAGQAGEVPAVAVVSPWDLWWACFRTAIPAGRLGVSARLPVGFCPACSGLAADLAAADPPRHPGHAGEGRCGCLLSWARRMRAPAVPVAWPPMSLTLALIKPGAPGRELRDRLEAGCEILLDRRMTLTAADTRRLYPEAYGAGFVAAVDAFLTSAPVRVLVLRQQDGGAAPPGELKKCLRLELGAADVLRNHLHMPDNPAEALADIRHLAGPGVLAGLYERHERDRASDRLAFYRAALGVRRSCPDRRASP